MKIRHLSVLLSIVLLAGCAAPTPATVNVEVTRIVIHTVEVTRIITATPVPPTATPEPSPTPEVTPTPEASPTPAFVVWTADQVVEAFDAAGLEVGQYRPMTHDDYGFAPFVATAGVRFFIPSLCAECGGRIMAFDSPAGLLATKEYYDSLGRESAVLFSWTFVRDNILVQINGSLPQDKAEQYRSALEGME